MKLPAIEIPDESSDKARQWAYRLAVLPFESTVEDVALLIAAAMADRGTCGTCLHLTYPGPYRAACGNTESPFRGAVFNSYEAPNFDGCIKGYTPKEAA